MLSIVHIIGILATVVLLVGVSILSGRKVKDARSFVTGGRSGSLMVCGAILGTLVGGQSTIGTAQLAFSYGLSAWWFTIGAALGALLLGVVYAGPLRRSGCTTLLEVVGKQYGRRAETVGSILFLVGIFISITSQLLSSSALITSLAGFPTFLSLVIGAILIALLVLFGGIRSAGASGIVKLVLLYISSLAAGIMVWRLAHVGRAVPGTTNIICGTQMATLRCIEELFTTTQLADINGIADIGEIHRRYGSFLARGPLKDLGGCLSLTLGVVCTQTYAQAIWSAASTPKARRGAVLCAALIPLIGAACTLVGIYMRGHYVTAAEAEALRAAGVALPEGIGIIENSLQAFPAFIIAHMPDWLGGIALGTLLINILGCGSGLVLGAATIVTKNVTSSSKRKSCGLSGRDSAWRKRRADLCVSGTQVGSETPVEFRTPAGTSSSDRQALRTIRLCIVIILLLGIVAAHFMRGAFINDLGFLSLGLRAAALLLPLSFALWLPGRFKQRSIVSSMIAGTAVMLLAGLMHWSPDPMYYGLLASAVVLFIIHS